jgi:hypothetical protein
MGSVLDRLTRYFVPTPPLPPTLTQPLWAPPALSVAASAPRVALTAAGQVPSIADTGPPLNQRPPFPAEWEAQAWGYYRHCGEARQAVGWLASAVSRCHLYIGEVPRAANTDPDPVLEPGIAGDVLAELHDGPIGQAAMLKRLAIHLLVPGATWLVGYPDPTVPAGEPEKTRWSVVSRKEWQQATEKTVRLKLPDHPAMAADGWVQLPADKVAFVPIYSPDPEDATYATSAFEAALETLDELKGLSRRVGADIQSRLVGAGVFPIPESATLMQAAGSEGANLQVDPFVQAFFEAAKRAIANPDDPSACLPIMFRVADETIANLKHLTFSTPFDAQLPVLREAARRTLAADLDIPASVVLGVDDLNHWCTLPDVEIMTAGGWKTHDQLSVGELVLTLNHDTGLSEWQPLLAVNTWHVTDEPMVAITGRRHSSVTTRAHRWPILHGRDHQHRRWTTSGDLLAQGSPDPDQQRYDYLTLSAPHADLPTTAKYDDAFVELLAWFFTEGRADPRAGRRVPQVTLYQSHRINPDNVARIRRALSTLYGPESTTLDKGGRYATGESVARRARARQLRHQGVKVAAIAARLRVSETMIYQYLRRDARVRDEMPRWRTLQLPNGMTRFVLNAAAAEQILAHAPARVVPPSFVRELTAAQLELFIDTAIRGDGHYLGTARTPIISQKNPAMLDALELAAILSGRSTYRYDHTSDGATATGPRPKTQHVLAMSRRTTFAPRGRNLDERTHSGTIWCPTTANGTWLARHEGTVFYTGNSAWAVQDDAVRAHIGPLISQICVAITLKILWPALRAAKVPDPETMCVWWDASAITQRPDRSNVVIAAATSTPPIISPRAARRELAFDEADAPDDEGTTADEGETPEGGVPEEEGGQPEPGQTPAPPASPGGQPEPEPPPAQRRRDLVPV